MSVDTVVFDVGNVLIEWNSLHLFRKLLPDDAAIEAFLQEVDFHGWNLEQDRGRSFAAGVAHFEACFPHHTHLARAFDARWQETVPGVIQGSVDILEKLRALDVPLYAITNFSAEKWAETAVRFPFLNGFQDVVVSAHEGVIKPDAAIYNVFLKRNALAAGQCVFIDDSAKNVGGARAAGMQALHFSDPETLLRDLRSLGFAI